MKTAAIYARVSSDKQREENTIASQTAALVAFAREQQFEVPQEWDFEDDGYSGASLIRPGLERVRDLAAEGLIQAVLIYAPDRLSRRYAHQILLIEEFLLRGTATWRISLLTAASLRKWSGRHNARNRKRTERAALNPTASMRCARNRWRRSIWCIAISGSRAVLMGEFEALLAKQFTVVHVRGHTSPRPSAWKARRIDFPEADPFDRQPFD